VIYAYLVELDITRT